MANVKEFIACSKKEKSRQILISHARNKFGKIKIGRKFLTLAGKFPVNIEDTEYYQWHKNKMFEDNSCFESVDYLDEIVEHNSSLHPQIMCIRNTIQKQCDLYSEIYDVINLDTQSFQSEGEKVLGDVLLAMRKRRRFLLFFSIEFANGYQTRLKPMKTVGESMKQAGEIMIMNPQRKELLLQLELLDMFWYEGCGEKSQTIMGTYVFWKP